MPVINKHRVALAIVGVLTTFACYDEDHPTQAEPPVPEPTYSVADITDDEVKEDRHMLEIAKEIRTFGGFYYNNRGELEIATTDPSSRSQAEQRVRRTLPPAALNGRPFASRTVQYSFYDLARYRAALRRTLFQIQGVTGLSVKESANRVQVDVTGHEIEAAVRL